MRALTIALALAAAAGSSAALAQQPTVGPPLGVTSGGTFTPMSENVKVYGAVVSAESCIYDPTRQLIMIINRGASQREAPNDGFVSLLNHDGSVHTARWIGGSPDGLTLNQPFGSDIRDGTLYLADSDGDTAEGDPRVAVLRMFDLATGAPTGAMRVEGATWLNDIAVAADGTIYATQTGSPDGQVPQRLWRVSADGTASVLVEGAPLSLPNGVAIDGAGNVAVLNMGNRDVLTFSPGGALLGTEQAAQAGNDGLVIMPDGTKYLSSVREGGIQRLRPGQPAELIATGVPSAASMCYDSDANQLVVPMNPNNAVAIVKL